MSLDKASQMIGLRKTSTDLPCKCGEDCGGYCSISQRMPPHLKKKLSAYLRDDCDRGFGIVEFLIAYAEQHKFILTGTVGGSSWRTASHELEIAKADWPRLRSYFHARDGYYGGRVQVFRPSAEKGRRYDIHSAYPAALSTIDLPIGEFRVVSGNRAAIDFNSGREGIFSVRGRVMADQFVPPLPTRLPSDRVAYPVGPVSGTWTALELRHAIASGSFRLERIESAMVWRKSGPILKPFVDRVWSLRARAGPESALGQWLKWFANSLTGKLAQDPEGRRVVINPTLEEIKVCQGKNRCAYGCNGRCGRWEMIGRTGRIFSARYFAVPDCAYVHWAAYLTAATRVKWRAQAIADGQEGRTMVYGDTDSIFTLTDRSDNIGPDLGQWGDDGSFREWRAIAPKSYSFRDDAGKVKVKCKGLPRVSEASWKAFLAGQAVTDTRGVESLLSAARHSESLWIPKSLRRSNRADGLRFGDRILRGDCTHPRTLASLLEEDT